VEASFLLPRSSGFTASVEVVGDGGEATGLFHDPMDGPPKARCAFHPVSGPARIAEEAGEDPVLGECRRFAEVVRGAADPSLLDAGHAVRAIRLAEAIRAVLV
jgi:predicted dehydrogenase